MLQHIKTFSLSNQNGLFINSCFAHCQTEIQDTWFASNGPEVDTKVRPNKLSVRYAQHIRITPICF